MGAVSMARLGGTLGGGVYAANRPQVDVSGALGAISQALTAAREGAIQRAYLQNQTQRQRELDARTAIEQAAERDFRQKQLEQQGKLAEGQQSIESQRIQSDADSKRQQLQIMKEIAQLRANATTDAAKTRAGATLGAAKERGPTAASGGQNGPSVKSMAAAQKSYTQLLQHYMTPQKGKINGINVPALAFPAADSLAKEAVRSGYPAESAQLWGAEPAPGAAPQAPQNTTQAAEVELTNAYRQGYQALDPKDPQFAQKKASLDQAMLMRLNHIHSQPPQPLPDSSATAGPDDGQP